MCWIKTFFFFAGSQAWPLFLPCQRRENYPIRQLYSMYRIDNGHVGSVECKLANSRESIFHWWPFSILYITNKGNFCLIGQFPVLSKSNTGLRLNLRKYFLKSSLRSVQTAIASKSWLLLHWYYFIMMERLRILLSDKNGKLRRVDRFSAEVMKTLMPRHENVLKEGYSFCWFSFINKWDEEDWYGISCWWHISNQMR